VCVCVCDQVPSLWMSESAVEREECVCVCMCVCVCV